LFAEAGDERLLDWEEGFAADVHGAFFREIKINDRDIFLKDVLPDVHLGPVGEGKDPDGFARVNAGVVEIP
jgi:hypothetical protein